MPGPRASAHRTCEAAPRRARECADPDLRGCRPPAQVVARVPGHPPDEVEVIVLNNDPPQDVRSSIGEPARTTRGYGSSRWDSKPGSPARSTAGSARARGGFVMFCNADLFPLRTYLAEMLDVLRRASRAPARRSASSSATTSTTDRPTDVIDTAGLASDSTAPHDASRRGRARFRPVRRGGRGLRSRRRGPGLAPVGARGDQRGRRVSGRELLRAQGRSRRVVAPAARGLGVLVRAERPSPTTAGRRAVSGRAGYLSAIRSFHRNEREKSQPVRIHAMKNQWLMLLKNEDGYNFVAGLPVHPRPRGDGRYPHLLFAPRSLVAVPMTLKVFRETLRKRRAAKAKQRMRSARAFGAGSTRERDSVPSTADSHADRGHRQHGRSLHEAALRTARGARGVRAARRLGDADGARSALAARDRSSLRTRPARLVDARPRAGSPSARGSRRGSTPTSTFRNVLSPAAPLLARTSSSPAEAESGRRRRTSPRSPRAAGEDWAFVPWWGSFSRDAADVASAARRTLGEDLHALGRRMARVWNAPSSRPGRAGRGPRPDGDRADHCARARAPRRTRTRRRAGRETRYPLRRTAHRAQGARRPPRGLCAASTAGELWIAGDGPLREAAESAAAPRPAHSPASGTSTARRSPTLYPQVDVLVVPVALRGVGTCRPRRARARTAGDRDGSGRGRRRPHRPGHERLRRSGRLGPSARRGDARGRRRGRTSSGHERSEALATRPSQPARSIAASTGSSAVARSRSSTGENGD